MYISFQTSQLCKDPVRMRISSQLPISMLNLNQSKFDRANFKLSTPINHLDGFINLRKFPKKAINYYDSGTSTANIKMRIVNAPL